MAATAAEAFVTQTAGLAWPAVIDPARQTSIARLSVDQYHRMVAAGIVGTEDAIELLDGWLIEKMPKNPPHRLSTRLVRQALEARVPPGWYVDSQEPITLATSEPEPDVSVIRGQSRDYSDRHPTATEVVLVVEVSESTLERDRTLKQSLYAAAQIPHYWIVNLVDRQLEQYSQPQAATSEAPAHYGQVEYLRPGESIALHLAGQDWGSLQIEDLLP